MAAEGYPFAEIHATAAWPGAKTRLVSEEEMALLSHFPTPSPVLAIGRWTERPWDPSSLTQGLTLALDRVQDPGNVGTVIRIADWFGVGQVLVSPDCADWRSQKAINASMGSFARVPVYAIDLPSALAGLKLPIWAAHALPGPRSPTPDDRRISSSSSGARAAASPRRSGAASPPPSPSRAEAAPNP